MLLSAILAAATALPFAAAYTADKQCLRRMCLSAIMNPDAETVTYHMDISSAGIQWAAVGFGTAMVGSPIVFLSLNSTGQVSLTHRLAYDHVEPPVVDYPPRVATIEESFLDFQGERSSFAFTIPANDDVEQYVIWAHSHTGPNPDGTQNQHCDKGRMILNLGGEIAEGETPPTTFVPLLLSEKQLVAHAALMATAFLFVLPIGALTARLLRTFVPSWVNPHALFQFGIALPLVTAGLVMIKVANRADAPLAGGHRRIGVAILCLYYLQVTLGIFILSYQPKGAPSFKGHAIQNYIHACLGLTIIALGFHQVYSGISWVFWVSTGRNVPIVYWQVWIAMVIVVAFLYIGGLLLLTRQFAQEREARKQASSADATSKPLMDEKPHMHEKSPSFHGSA